jgi:hypothetical protein
MNRRTFITTLISAAGAAVAAPLLARARPERTLGDQRVEWRNFTETYQPPEERSVFLAFAKDMKAQGKESVFRILSDAEEHRYQYRGAKAFLGLRS